MVQLRTILIELIEAVIEANRICNRTLIELYIFYQNCEYFRLGSISEFNRIVIDQLDSISSIKFDANRSSISWICYVWVNPATGTPRGFRSTRTFFCPGSNCPGYVRVTSRITIGVNTGHGRTCLGQYPDNTRTCPSTVFLLIFSLCFSFCRCITDIYFFLL